MGDHGNRYGGILSTDIGFVETSMPLFHIHIPEQLNHQHPHLLQHLRRNSDRLTTWSDLHKMLKDVPESSYAIQSPGKIDDGKYSVWRQLIPMSRTCAEAKIHQQYCVCIERQEVDIEDDRVQSAARAVIRFINTILEQVDLECSKLWLLEIKDAKVSIRYIIV